MTLSRLRLEGDGSRLRLLVVNSTPIESDPENMGRADALELSLISTLPVLEIEGGRFVSPLEARECENVNTWPVLASAGDEAIVGAAIVLPDHPVISPRSKGNLFDGTEIEEALLLHIHALSDAEQEEIAGQDPRVREMIRRARATTAKDLMDLHGIVRPVESQIDVTEDIPGESSVEFGGSVFRRGDQVRIRPGERARPEDRKDAYDMMLAGKTATIERIYLDTDDRTYFGVTIDDDPGQDLMRDMGRYLFFFIDEVEPMR
jgi:hypothetical protein